MTGLAVDDAPSPRSRPTATPSTTPSSRKKPSSRRRFDAGTRGRRAAAAAAPTAETEVRRLTMSGYFRGGFGASNQKGRMTCFSLANPARAGLQVPARQRMRGLVASTHLTMVDLRGRRRRRRDLALHADRLTSRRPTSAIRRTAPSIRRAIHDLDRRDASPSPTSTPTSRASPGCSAGRPGSGPATTSGNRSTSATSSTGTRRAWARGSRTSTSAPDLRLSYAACSPSTGAGPRQTRPRRCCRCRSTSAFATTCSCAGIKLVGER